MTVASDTSAAAEQVIVSEHQLREKVINEEFKIWKKTVPLLYDTIHTIALEYPSLLTDFYPQYTVSDNKNVVTAKLALGTNTSGKGQDYVHIMEVALPSTLAPDFADFAFSENIPIPANVTENAIKKTHLWKHPGEVNAVRVSPDGKRIVTFDNKGAIHIFREGEEADQKLAYHSEEGYCLEWISELQFLSGANDNKIALWDISATSAPVKVFNSHSAVINDISYSKPSKVLFGSVADDYYIQIHDLRAPEESPAMKFSETYIQNAIQFHPEITTLFATAGRDNLVTLYDARNTKEPLRKFYGHNDSVVGLKWGGSAEPDLLYSWGLDKRVLTWDLSQLGEDFTPSFEVTDSKKRLKQTADPCLQFIHGGHTRRINDFAVHPTIPGLLASVGDDCLLEVYKPKDVFDHADDNSDSEEKAEESGRDSKGDDEDDGAQSDKVDEKDLENDPENDEDMTKGEEDEESHFGNGSENLMKAGKEKAEAEDVEMEEATS
ncbi:hypothetical protein PUMCH_001888 [Australozyma saopauloensis]|uniref:Histone-binding protein RBBP4-like N-terminal domain-containing protein n=1 Tax=Australozyma saopauloensis TaxID=291208 RepID=A0AAX4H8N6_9ASCO|nr:hypothetical protein PUMCH_001888 [[Candida] saopauloensis]